MGGVIEMKFKLVLFKMADIFEEKEEFLAIRRSMISAIPILLLGSFALLLTSFPLDSYQNFINSLADGKVVSLFQSINNAAFGLYSIVLVVAISSNYAMLKNMANEAIRTFPIITLASYIAISGMNHEDFVLSNFGVSGIFIAIMSAVISSKLLCYFYQVFHYKHKNHAYGVDYTFSIAMRTIMPAIIIISLFALAYQVLLNVFGYSSFQQLFTSVATGLFENVGNDLGGALIFVFFVQFLWFFGIHGSNVFDAVAQNNFIEPVTANIANIEKGMKATEIFSKPFYDVFVLMGGCGTVLSLLLAILIVGKRSNTRGVAKMGLMPALFNISEIVVFGLPVIFTPIFFLPFLLVPIVLLLISYGVTAIGLVPCVSENIQWTTPIILGGFKATGSYAGSILQIVNLIIGALIYIPFVKLYEEKLYISFKTRIKVLEQELWEKEAVGQKTDFLLRNDRLGSTAKMLVDDLKYAMEQRELYLEYQPQVNLKGDCIGAEALLRWKHPLVGNIIPPLIITLAKEAGYLSEIERYLFDEVSARLHELETLSYGALKMSVNITAESLHWLELEDVIGTCIEKYQVKRERLCLEVTEQDTWLNSQVARDKLKRLKDKGHTIIIDDFGMGHTSLMYLQTNMFGIVKLDGLLTRGIEINRTNKEIISSILYLSKTLKFDVIAEYVETQEQRDVLKQLGCTGFQGYLYSKPIKFEEFKDLIKRQNLYNN